LLLCDVLLPGTIYDIDVAEMAVNAQPEITVVPPFAGSRDGIDGLTYQQNLLQKPPWAKSAHATNCQRLARLRASQDPTAPIDRGFIQRS